MPLISKTPSGGEPTSPSATEETAAAAAPPEAVATTATESDAANNHDSPAAEASIPSTNEASEPVSVAAAIVETPPVGGEDGDGAVTEMPQPQPQPTRATVPPGTCFVEGCPRDPLAVEAEYLGGPGFGQLTDKLKTLATPPLEFCATLADNFKAGEAITVQGPLGPITVEPPPEAEAGMSLRYQLVPRPDFRVHVSPNTQPGTEVRFDRGDGVEISAMVPTSLQDGDAFEVSPPALMVRVPDNGVAGTQIAFRSCSDFEETAEWFGLTLPEGCQPGRYVTAKLPHPRKRGGLKALKSQAWEWKAQAMKEIKGGSLQLLRQLQRTPHGDLHGKGGVASHIQVN